MYKSFSCFFIYVFLPVYLYYWKHKHECFIRYKMCGTAERFVLSTVPQPSADNTNFCHNNSSYPTRPHSIIVYYTNITWLFAYYWHEKITHLKVKRYPALLEDNSQCQHTECSSGVISFMFKWLNPPLYASQRISFQQFCHANNNVR